MKKKTAATEEAYVRVPGYAELLAGIHLPAEVWAVFAQCDTPRRPAEIARRAHLEEKEVTAALRRLARRRLVQKHQLDWQAYLASQGAPDAPVAPLAPVAASAPVAPVAPAAPVATAAPFATSAPFAMPPPAPAPVPTAVAPERVVAPANASVRFTVVNFAAAEARRRAAHDVVAVHVGRGQATRAVLAA